MEVQLAERDAEIYALRVQLSELSTAKGELGIVTPSKGAQSLQRSSSGSQLDLDATAPRPPSRPPSRDGNRGGSGDGASGRSGRENGGGAAFGSGPQRMVPPASASSAQQTPPSPGGAADPSMSQQQPAEVRPILLRSEKEKQFPSNILSVLFLPCLPISCSSHFWLSMHSKSVSLVVYPSVACFFDD
jgi:hypothetical protein